MSPKNAPPPKKKKVARKRRSAHKKKSRSRSQRLKEKLFADVKTFNTDGGGFVPLPAVLRAMLWFFAPRTWMTLTDIYMRTSKEGVCWFELGELGHDMDFRSKGKLRIHLRDLEDMHFIVSAEDGGKEYFAAVDPREAIIKLIADGKIPPERLDSINDVLEIFNQQTIGDDSEEES